MFLAIFLFTILSASAAPVNDPAWEEYKLKFEKTYSAAEDDYRYGIWKQSEEEINLHNADYSQTYTQELNYFSDMTDEEFRAFYDCSSNTTEEFDEENNLFEPEPTSETTVNWATKGYVTKIKNQGHCGSCYSFGAAGALEGQWFKKTGKLVSLSEQQIIDCSGRWGNHGCHGGLTIYAWKYIRDVGGIASEASYPYRARQYHCRGKPSHVVAKCTGFKQLRRFDEIALRDASAQVGPISVSIDAGHRSFRAYKHGVYDEPRCSRTRHNHAVLLVGYGTENGKAYWLIKNSWGEKWGMKGFGKMSRNKNSQCAIASNANFPTV